MRLSKSMRLENVVSTSTVQWYSGTSHGRVQQWDTVERVPCSAASGPVLRCEECCMFYCTCYQIQSTYQTFHHS